MKLIINIPNKIYEEILKNKGTDKSLDFDKSLILEVAVENGTPLEEEFKKIKDEIENTGAYEQEVHGKTEFLKGITYCLNIIDNRIKKLKEK